LSESREKRSRKAVRAALSAIDGATGGRPLAAALSQALRDEEKLGPQERRAAALAARGVLRELRRIDLAIARAASLAGVSLKRLPAQDRTLVRYLALRVSVEREPAQRSLRELALPGPRRPRSIGDDVLEKLAAAMLAADDLPLPDNPVAALGIRRSVPDFLAARLIDELGSERADAVLAALNEPARLDLRANRLLATRDEVQKCLAVERVETRLLPLAPDGLFALDRTSLFGRTHAEGLFELQDEGSQLIALLGEAAPGETVIDLCAGSGGKSLALAAAVGGKGRVVACDRVGSRLAELPARVRRARAQGIVEVGGKSPAEELAGKADLVLVDAPCSGIGSLRREPDLRWRLTERGLDEFPALQGRILDEASRFVRVAGRLVYATCSPLRSEDQSVVQGFLARNPGFSLEEAGQHLPEPARAACEGGFLRVWPDRHRAGAFFGARMRRLN
jgi:16S rRNA (cytosine967-C5)-methyltransferase